MTRFFNPCGHYREQISLLVSESLPDAERTSLEQHLSTCAGCRRYRDEIKVVAGSLLRWEGNFASLQPSEAALTRWRKDFAAILKLNRPASRAFPQRVFNWCWDVIWPSRWIWAGLAAVWAVILALNFSQPSQIRTSAARSVSPSPELVRAFLEGGGFLDQPQAIHPEEKNAEPPGPPAPRSEQRSGPVSSQAI